MQINQHKLLLLLWPVFFISLGLAVYRDIKNVKDGYSCDLRKRIVGARYQAAGLSPYYYKWQPGDDERLADPFESGPSVKENVVTMPPGYLWLLQPLALLHFSNIETTWFIVQYVLLLSVIAIFFSYSKKTSARIGLLILSALFLFSKGWIYNVDIGQSYILFPFLWTVGYFAGSKKLHNYFFAGVMIAICCWLRPVCLLMAIPFLFCDRRSSFLKGCALVGFLCVMQIFLFHQFQDWKDFVQSSLHWTQYYNRLSVSTGPGLGIGNWPTVIEGQTDFHQTALPQYTANLPVLFGALLAIHLPSLYYLLGLFCLLVLFCIFLYKRKTQIDRSSLWLAGFTMYYLGELFVSVPKPSYYFTELLFPLCIVIYRLDFIRQKFVVLLLFLGLLLATLFFHLIPLQLLVAEYLLAAVIIFFLCSQLFNNACQNSRQTS